MSDCAFGQSAGVAQRPYLGWSSFSQQTIASGFLTQANIAVQSDLLLSSGLQAHGFNYINIDDGWQLGLDDYGRPTANVLSFPDIGSLISHIHQNGQKAGISWAPGVPSAAVTSNAQILNTSYHIKDILMVPYAAGNTVASSTADGGLTNYKIDYTKAGAQEYVDSVTDLFASWGVDFIRIGAVGPSAFNGDVDNLADVAAWGTAIAQSNRSMWLTLSSALNQDYAANWSQYSNARQIGTDIECEGRCSTITNWTLTSQRFFDLLPWQNYANEQAGWNDLGSLMLGKAALSGLNSTERQTAMTLWTMANSPLYVGGDLSAIDQTALDLLTNDEVLAVDQSGSPASQIAGGMTPVWASSMGEGVYYVAVFNLNASPAPVTVRWNELGFEEAVSIRDLWAHKDLGPAGSKFAMNVMGHGSRLFKVALKKTVVHELAQSYEAEYATSHGVTTFSTCKTCSGGNKAVKLGSEVSNTLTFNDVYVDLPGTYRVEIAPASSGPRDLFFQVNGDPASPLKFGGTSFNLPSSTIVPIALRAGSNTIQFGNRFNAAPDLDRISVLGLTLTPTSPFHPYEAEEARLGGTEYATPCAYCSGGSKVASLDQSTDNTVTFDDVEAPGAGLYELEVDYTSSGRHSLFLQINDGQEIALDLEGAGSMLPTSTVVPIPLMAGRNKLQFGSHDFTVPALDRIAVQSLLGPTELTTSLIAVTGDSPKRVWTFAITNNSDLAVHGAQIDLLSLTQVSGQGSCQPKAGTELPVAVGDIPAHAHTSIQVPVDFSTCSENANFSTMTVFSSDRGSIIGNSFGFVSAK